jgi:protein-disulfide isomerase
MIKTIKKLKIPFLLKIFTILLFFSLKSYAEEYKNNIVLGSYDAIVKIKVFSSYTCPHCAAFHKEIVSEINKEYVETGKVQIIFIDFPLDQAAFNASKLINCAEKNKQISLMDIIYDEQNEWASGSDINQINDNLKKIVKNLGINSNQFDKCLVNENISDKILGKRIDSQKKYSINSTPTIIINEKKFEGSVNFKNIKKQIEKLI